MGEIRKKNNIMLQMSSCFRILMAVIILGCTNLFNADHTVKIDDNVRAEQIKEMKWGMFILDLRERGRPGPIGDEAIGLE